MNTSPAEIRLLVRGESPQAFAGLARLHAQEITEGFLTSLGQPLLTRLYRAIATSPDAFILVWERDGKMDGFLCASTDTKSVFRHVIRRAWQYLLPAVIRTALKPRTIRRCWETLRYPKSRAVTSGPKAEILNFCVDRSVQRSGIGRQLFAAMETEYRRRGIAQIRIVTGASQQSAIQFYEKLGATRKASIEIHAKVESHLFHHTIRDCHPANLAKT